MNNTVNNELMINVSQVNSNTTIQLRGRFTFGSHREFKHAYTVELNTPEVHNIIVDLSDINYLDSSALGMLLVLRERAITANKNLILSNPNLTVARTFEITNFYQIFTIQ